MLKYNELKTKPREFLASTGLKRDEFEQLLPAFRAAYEKKYPPDLTQEGTPRQRQFLNTMKSRPTSLLTGRQRQRLSR